MNSFMVILRLKMCITTISNVSLENNLKTKCSIQHLLNLITMPK